MDIDLKGLRTSRNIPAKEMVNVVKALYPKYDKTIQSKCENGNVYGVRLQSDAEDAICEKFAPELKRKKKDGHRLTCRISCRLETAEWNALMKNIRADGYNTVQDWLTHIVRRYNKRKEQANERNSNQHS